MNITQEALLLKVAQVGKVQAGMGGGSHQGILLLLYVRTFFQTLQQPTQVDLTAP